MSHEAVAALQGCRQLFKAVQMSPVPVRPSSGLCASQPLTNALHVNDPE